MGHHQVGLVLEPLVAICLALDLRSDGCGGGVVNCQPVGSPLASAAGRDVETVLEWT